ncbi:MAG: class I SAM-dependent methyltransferase, partial [Bacteroidetes bacterium]
MSLFTLFKNIYSKEHQLKALYKLRSIKAFLFSGNLTKLAIIHKTDKYGYHFYTPHYQKHFRHFKYKRIKLLEIGVGGYNEPLIGANSLRMWKSYFPFARIFYLDTYDKSILQEHRIKIYKGSQV